MARDSADNDRVDSVSLDRLPRWLRDFIDLSNEAADRETGRMRRFNLSDKDDGPQGSEKKHAERRLDALLLLLQDPVYARLYYDVTDTITRAEAAADRAMNKLLIEAKLAGENLKTIMDAAAELPDGRKVFKTKDGRLVTEEGRDVSNQASKVKGLTDQSPNEDDYSRAADKADEYQRRIAVLETYRTEVLDPARQRLSDTDRTLAPDELREIKRRVEDAPPELKTELQTMSAEKMTSSPPAKSAADEYQAGEGWDAERLFGKFRAASSVIPDDAFAPPAPGPGAKR